MLMFLETMVYSAKFQQECNPHSTYQLLLYSSMNQAVFQEHDIFKNKRILYFLQKTKTISLQHILLKLVNHHYHSMQLNVLSRNHKLLLNILHLTGYLRALYHGATVHLNAYILGISGFNKLYIIYEFLQEY